MRVSGRFSYFMLFSLMLSGFFTTNSRSEDNTGITASISVYKDVDNVKLNINVYSPDGLKKSDKRPAIVFFFGGGWVGGTIDHFKPQAEYYARKGIVCFTPNYRIASKNKTTPRESLKDARSAMRWVRKHAAEYGVDPDKIIASGGSAGGHLAAACAYTSKINEDSDDLSISTRPCALILYNPVIDNGPDGYGYDRVKDYYQVFSPMHNITPPALPTIFMLGTKDNLIPVATGEKFKQVTEENGGSCELVLYEGRGHGFFNKEADRKLTFEAVDKFLQQLGMIENSG